MIEYAPLVGELDQQVKGVLMRQVLDAESLVLRRLYGRRPASGSAKHQRGRVAWLRLSAARVVPLPQRRAFTSAFSSPLNLPVGIEIRRVVSTC